MAATTPMQLALARAYQRRNLATRLGLRVATLRAYDHVADYTDDDEADDFADTMVPITRGAQRALASTLRSYVHLVTDDDDTDDMELDDVTGDAVQPAGAHEHWRIPFYSLWKALGAGVVLAEAVAATRNDVARQAMTDLAFTQAAAMRELGSSVDAVRGWQRVLSGPGCEFCAEAADEVYASDDLMPVHVGCMCGVAPVVDDQANPGATLNDATMAA